MPNHLNIPPDLNHLIEKRDGQERRQSKRRSLDVEPGDDEDQDHRQSEERRLQDRRGED